MAIIRCKKCKRLFADKSIACPHCGEVFEKDTTVQERAVKEETVQRDILDEEAIKIRDDKRRKLDEEKKEKVRLRWEEQEKERTNKAKNDASKNTDQLYLMRFFYVSVFTIFVTIVGFWIYDTPEEIKQAKIEKQEEMLIQAQKAEENRIAEHLNSGKYMLKKMMRDPDSFELIDMYSSTNNAGCYKYRAKNGFGGMTVGVAVYTEVGVLITSDDTDLFEIAFKENCMTKAK